MKELLQLEDVSRCFTRHGIPAVDRLNLSIADRGITALSGESGCGKSTLLKMIAGFEVPDSGRITQNNQVLSGPGLREWVPPEKRNFSMMFQCHALFPHLTVDRNIGFGLSGNGNTPHGRRRIGELLELINMKGYEKRYPHQLSGGQQQRVALARVIAPNPRLLLMDEPFNNLNVHLKHVLVPDIRKMLVELQIPTIVVTHDSVEVFELADRILIMREGRIIQDGSPREIYENPAGDYVANFFGKINRIILGDGSFALRPESIVINPQSPIEEELRGNAIIMDVLYLGGYFEVWIKVKDTESPLDGHKLLAYSRSPSVNYREGEWVNVSIPRNAMVPLEF